MKTIFKQTYQQLKEQPIISIVSIAGTALSLFLIMLVVMIQQVKVAPFSPESNRDRMLHVKFGSLFNVIKSVNPILFESAVVVAHLFKTVPNEKRLFE